MNAKDINNIPIDAIINSKDDLHPNCIKKMGRFYSVVIPKGVMMIKNRAFMHWRYLKSIEISESVMIIEDRAFAYCDNLDTIVVNKNNKVFDSRDNCNAIIRTEDDKLIFACKATTIPNGVKSIDKNAFAYCRCLSSLFIPKSLSLFNVLSIRHKDTLKSIEVDINNRIYDSRDKCNAIIRSCNSSLIFACNYSTIPDGVKTIDDNAFKYCSELKSISVPDGVLKIGNNAFSNCLSLEKIDLPNTVESIGVKSFEACLLLGAITLPQSLSEICESAFENCSKLSCVSIQKGLKSIGSYAFCGCQKLEEIFFPDSIESIGDSIFYPHSLIKRILIPKGSKDKFESLLPQYKDKLIEVADYSK